MITFEPERGKVTEIQVPAHSDDRGILHFIETQKNLPFQIKRVYFLSEVPQNASRGAHAHKSLKQLIVASCGNFRVKINTGFEQREYWLINPGSGLLLEGLVWRDLYDFSPGAVCTVLASEHYDETDYVREFDDFLQLARESYS